jgi:hypothetical protein
METNSNDFPCAVCYNWCVLTIQFLVQTAPITNEVYTRIQSMSSSDQSQEIGKLWNEMPRYSNMTTYIYMIL